MKSLLFEETSTTVRQSLDFKGTISVVQVLNVFFNSCFIIMLLHIQSRKTIIWNIFYLTAV